MPLPTLLLDSEQAIMAMSPVVAETFPGLAAAAGETLEALFHPRDRKGTRGFHRALAKVADGILDCEINLRDDSPVRLRMSEADGGWVLCLQDLREERAAQAHLQGMKGELGAILACMGDGLLILDPEGRLKDINQAAQRCFRFSSSHGVELSAEALHGKEVTELFGEHAATLGSIITRVSDDPDALETLPLVIGGRSLMLSVNPIFVPKQGYAGACITVRDLTEVEGLHARLKRVMDNVQQGLFTLNLDGHVGSERSAKVADHLGECAADTPFESLLDLVDAKAAANFSMQWDQLTSGFMPLDLCLDQLPDRVHSGERTIQIEWSPIQSPDGELEEMLVVSTDITEVLAAQAAKALQAESLQAFQAIGRDRRGFLNLHRDASRLLDRIGEGPGEDQAEFERVLHTLKGNAGIMGLTELMTRCHRLEEALQESDELAELDCSPVVDWWLSLNEHIESVLQEGSQGLRLDPEELEAMESAIRSFEPHNVLLARLRNWHNEPASARLGTLGQRAEQLAERLGKPGLKVHLESDGLRMDPERYAPFWGSLVHVIRNAMDHGIESPEQRVAAGKDAAGQLWLRASETPDALVVEIEDDGGGVDWEAVRERALEAGLPAASHDDLVKALTRSKLSTAAEVTDVSGRGVGVGAVVAEVDRLGGRFTVDSQRGRGTCMRIELPKPVEGGETPSYAMAG